jgi:hypothetical protein
MTGDIFFLVAIHECYFLERKAQAMNCFNRNAIPLYGEET